MLICSGIIFFRPWKSARAIGFAIVISGAVAATFATVVAKRGITQIAPRVLMLWRNVIAFVVIGIYVFVRFELPPFTIEVVVLGIAIGVLGPYLHVLFFLQALEYVDAAKAALVNRVQPAMVFLIPWLFLSRIIDAADLVSVSLLVAGAAWLGLRAAPEESVLYRSLEPQTSISAASCIGSTQHRKVSRKGLHLHHS